MIGVFLVCVAAVLWGTVGVANGLMSGRVRIDPTVVGLMRTALGAATLLLTAEALSIPRTQLRRLPLRRLAAFGAAGAVFQICLFAAFARVGVTVTVAVTVCLPVVLVAGADAIWEGHLPDPGVSAAICIAVAGVMVALLVGRGQGAAGRVDPYGCALLAGASAAFAVLAASARVLTRVVHPVRAAGLGLATTMLILAAIALARSGLDPMLPIGLPERDLALLAYTGVAATGGAYLAFVLGMHLSRSAAAGLAATLIEPGVAALLAALVLGEQLSAGEAGGCGLLLAAMVLLFVNERHHAVAGQ
jgi:drug/metabolite transporter, DME family